MSESNLKGEALCLACGYYMDNIALTGNVMPSISGGLIYECYPGNHCPGCDIPFRVMFVDRPIELVIPLAEASAVNVGHVTQ